MKKRTTSKVKPGPGPTWSTPQIKTWDSEIGSYRRTRIPLYKIKAIADGVSFKRNY